MFSHFAPVPASNPTPAKSADAFGGHKPESAAPADGASFHELLNRKNSEAAPPKSRAGAESKSAERPSRSTTDKPLAYPLQTRGGKAPAKNDRPAAGDAACDQASQDADTTSAEASPDKTSASDSQPDQEGEDAKSRVVAQPLLLDPALAPVAPVAPPVALGIGLPVAGGPTQAEGEAVAGEGGEVVETPLVGGNVGAGLPKFGSASLATSARAAALAKADDASATAVTGQAFKQPAAPAPAVAADPVADVLGTATSAAAQSAETPPQAGVSTQVLARQNDGAPEPAAQIAVAAGTFSKDGNNSGGEKNKNSAQDNDVKADKKQDVGDGIRRAYELPSMNTATPVFQAPTVTVHNVAPVVPGVVPTVASTAVRMVEKVSEVADHVAAHPSEQVTVRIDLDEGHRVDVHVSMRGGQVHADFRSDSPDMRAALASAWNEFSQNGRDGSGHRWAEPAFTQLANSSTPANQSNFSSNLQTSTGSGQDSARRQAAEREAAPAWSGGGTRSGGSTPTTTAAKAGPAHSDNSQHLSVLA